MHIGTLIVKLIITNSQQEPTLILTTRPRANNMIPVPALLELQVLDYLGTTVDKPIVILRVPPPNDPEPNQEANPSQSSHSQIT